MENSKKRNKRKKIIIILGCVLAVIAFLTIRLIIGWFMLPEIDDNYKVGKWYRISVEGLETANGNLVHGNIRIGDSDKVIVYFHGGGASINEYTAARPLSGETADNGFYSDDVSSYVDVLTKMGIGAESKDNPFKDYTILMISYNTGDFHIGTTDYDYTDLKGEKSVLHHHGYLNYTAILQEALQYINSDPEQLLIVGSSAGGFGASLLASDVMGYFPNTENVTVCVDSSLLLYDGWHDTAKDLWKAPDEIVQRLTTDNITLDSLVALHQEHENVKILFTCSYRDGMLGQYQSYLNGKDYVATKEGGDILNRNLKEMVEQMEEQIPNCGLYIFDSPYSDKKGEETLTVHTVLLSDLAFDRFVNGKSVSEWIVDAMNGEINNYGLELLEK